MKLRSLIFPGIFFVAVLSFQSCSDEDSNDDDFAGCNNFQADYTQLMEALNAYSQNPGPETCEAYKNALLDFYDDYKDCTYWSDDYQEAYDDIQEINCSEVGEV